MDLPKIKRIDIPETKFIAFVNKFVKPAIVTRFEKELIVDRVTIADFEKFLHNDESESSLTVEEAFITYAQNCDYDQLLTNILYDDGTLYRLNENKSSIPHGVIDSDIRNCKVADILLAVEMVWLLTEDVELTLKSLFIFVNKDLNEEPLKDKFVTIKSFLQMFNIYPEPATINVEAIDYSQLEGDPYLFVQMFVNSDFCTVYICEKISQILYYVLDGIILNDPEAGDDYREMRHLLHDNGYGKSPNGDYTSIVLNDERSAIVLKDVFKTIFQNRPLLGSSHALVRTKCDDAVRRLEDALLAKRDKL